MYTLGIDIGSTSSKAVILENGNSIVARSLYALGAGTSGAARVIDDLFEKANLSWDDISYCIATGYGRQRFDQANEEISELSCHALGMNHLLPGIRTIIDIGGQDVKVLSLNDQGMLENFVMNEKCAAGTGRFLDVMAGVLETTTDELGNLDAQATDPVKISSTCTVFAESEVISLIALNKEKADIAHGLHKAIANKSYSLLKRVGLNETFMMTGGVAKNPGVVKAVEEKLGSKLFICKEPEIVGALGAALFGLDK